MALLSAAKRREMEALVAAGGALPPGNAPALLRLLRGGLPVQARSRAFTRWRDDRSPTSSMSSPPSTMRLLGYPRDAVLSERAGELADWAREWYAAPRASLGLRAPGGAQRARGAIHQRAPGPQTLEQAEAHGAVLVAASAGPELESRSAKTLAGGEARRIFLPGSIRLGGGGAPDHHGRRAALRVGRRARHGRSAALQPGLSAIGTSRSSAACWS